MKPNREHIMDRYYHNISMNSDEILSLITNYRAFGEIKYLPMIIKDFVGINIMKIIELVIDSRAFDEIGYLKLAHYYYIKALK